MDNQQTPPVAQQPPVQQTGASIQQPVSQPVQKEAPQHPVSGPHKEAGPILQAPVAEYVRPTEIQPQLSPEMVEAGVEVVANKEHPQLTPEHKAVGIEPAKDAVPVVIPQTPSVQLPYDPIQVKTIEKTVPITESKHWLAVLTEYIMKKLHTVQA